jgi:Xaa-Pro dipeptidase
MPVSDKEMARRIAAVREEMTRAHLAGLIVFSQVVLGEKAAVRYLSGYRLLTRKDYLVLPLSGDPCLIVPTLGQQKAASGASWIGDVRHGGDTPGIIRQVAERIRAAGIGRGTIGICGFDSIPRYDYELLRGELAESRLVDATGLLDSVRQAKSPEEVEYIRQTTAIADRCYDKVLEVLRPGIDEREVMGEINKLLTLEGVEDTLILTSKGRSFTCFISPPGSYKFADGDHYVFSIEISGPSGYWSQIVRPMCVGTPSETYQHLFKAGKEATQAGVAKLVPGSRAGEVARAVGDQIRGMGLTTGLWCGHAMGMDLGDGLGLSEDNSIRLQEGSIITLHPHIMTADGEAGLLMGDTFVVTEAGASNLSRTTCELKSVC